MRTLQRVLAQSVLEALRSRDHVVVAPSGDEALRNEVEAIIEPALQAITPHLGDHVIRGEVNTTFGHDTADEAVETMIDHITEQLMESDHVDDIFAEDRVIRRDAFRAIRDILLGYIRGDVTVDEEFDTATSIVVALDTLGYVVSTASRRVEETLLGEALERAATPIGGTLLLFNASENTATFALRGGAEVGRLALEESITEEIVNLVHADLVELPGIQQVLEVEFGAGSEPGFADAIERAATRVSNQTGCAASCVMVDARTMVATLTPLSQDAAAAAEEHFNFLLTVLEAELMAMEPAAEAPPSSQKAAAKERKPQSGKRPSKRGAAKKAAKATPSQTRARGRSTKATKKRRAKA